MEDFDIKSIGIITILLAALWLWQSRPIPVDRSWWRDDPVREWRVEHGDLRIVCVPGGCEGTRKNGERVRL